jgi:hypothetical protein
MPGSDAIISFIDQPDVIKKFFNTWDYGKSPRPPERLLPVKEIIFDPSTAS